MRKKIFGILMCGILILGLTGCDNKKQKEQEFVGTIWLDNSDYFQSRYEFYKAGMAKMIALDENGEEDDYWDMLWKLENNILILSYTDGEIYNKYELNETKTQLISISEDEILTKIDK